MLVHAVDSNESLRGTSDKAKKDPLRVHKLTTTHRGPRTATAGSLHMPTCLPIHGMTICASQWLSSTYVGLRLRAAQRRQFPRLQRGFVAAATGQDLPLQLRTSLNFYLNTGYVYLRASAALRKHVWRGVCIAIMLLKAFRPGNLFALARPSAACVSGGCCDWVAAQVFALQLRRSVHAYA